MEERDKEVIGLMQQGFGTVPSKISKGSPGRIAQESEKVLQQYAQMPPQFKTSPPSESSQGLIGNSVDTYVDHMLQFGEPGAKKGVGENVAFELNQMFGSDANTRFYQASKKMNPQQKKLFADFLQALGRVSDRPQNK